MIFTYKGLWNVSTNSPELQDGIGTIGDLYLITKQPPPVPTINYVTNRNLGTGDKSWFSLQFIFYNGTTWEQYGGGTTGGGGVIQSINTLTAVNQFLVSGSTGLDFNIVSSGDTHTFNIPIASSGTTGKLSSTDWTTFNNKLSSINGLTTVNQFLVSGTTGNNFNIVSSGNTHTFNLPIAASGTTGKLTNTDWIRFNNIANSGITSLSGEAFAYGPGNANTTLSNSAVIGKVLTGFVAAPGKVTSTDSILSAFNKTIGNQLEVFSTGLFDFSGISLSGTTKFNVGTVRGYIVDNTSNSSLPTLTDVMYPATSGITTPYLNTSTATFILVTSGNTLLLQPTFPTPAQRRQNIYLGAIAHPAMTIITTAFSSPDITLSSMAQVRDMWSSIKFINGGITPSANGANLNFNISSGSLFGLGVGWTTSTLNPSSVAVAAQTPASFLYRTQTGGGPTIFTAIDPANYDVAGTITAIPGGTNVSSNQRIFLSFSGAIIVQYGQNTYPTLVDAIAGIQSESFTTFPNLTIGATLIGILSVRKSATNLSDTSQARFLATSKFGEVTGAAAGISVTSLQTAYNNSAVPQITTSASLGAATIRNGAGADTVSVLDIQSSGATTTASILGNGTVNATRFVTAGGTSAQFVKGDGSLSAGGGSATPSGATGSIQYNLGGAFAGSTRANIAADDNLLLIATSSITALPSSGTTKIYANNRTGIEEVRVSSGSDGDYTLQNSIGQKLVGTIYPTNGAVVGNGHWQSFAGSSGTLSNTTKTYDATNLQPNYHGLRATSAAASGSTATFQVNSTQRAMMVGNNVNGGGAKLIMTLAFPTYVSTQRIFAGYWNNAAAIPSVEPSTLTNIFGIAKDSTDTTLQLIFNDNAGACTKANTGITPNTNNVYRITIYIPSNSVTFYATVEDMSKSGITVYNSPPITTNLPITGSLLMAQMGTGNGTVAVATTTLLIQMYEEQY